ncbi:MAG: DUF4281 domain-containing protein [Acidimicrobiia bacterium]|nr:DUF4281 domain-containing protein [Acidimicrobiia bacterium]
MSDPMPTLAPSTAVHRRGFAVLNASTMPLWVAMIVFPRARVTRWLADRIGLVLAGLGVSYVALLAVSAAEGGEKPSLSDLGDPDTLRRGMTSPTAFLAGWAHYLAFDLFVGRWIWEQNLAAGRTARLPLLCTWWFGPLGLTIELARRRRRRG